MGWFSDMATKVIGGVVSGGLGYAFDTKAREQNFYYNEMAAQSADARQRAQFYDMYSYPAQVKLLKEAGLNPALMYSGGASGQGGATAPQGLGAGGLHAGYAPIDPMTATQIQLAKSQENLNDAEAQKLKADTEGQEIENYVAELTKDTSVEERKQNLQVLIALGTKYLSETSLNIAAKDKTNWETTWSQIKSNEELQQIRNQNALYLAQIATEKTKQQLNEQQTSTLSAQIDKWQMDVTQRYYELDIQSWSQEAQENWFISQADNLINRLEFDNKALGLNLDFSNKKMWVDNSVDVLKSAIVATGLVFTRGNVNLGVPKVTFGPPKKVGF